MKWPATRSGRQTVSVFVQRTDLSISDQKTVDIDVISVATPTVAATPTTATVDAQPTADLSVPDNAEPTADTGSTGSTGTGGAQAAPPTTEPPTNEPPTQAPPPTASGPQVRVKSGANVRRGPSTSFEPALGGMSAGQTAEILAKNADSSWYKIRFYNGEGWIAAVTVDVEGNVSSLPVEAGPPTPIPVTVAPTAAPATSAPTTCPDLVVSEIRVNPHPFTCGQSSSIVVVIKNNGTAASAGTEVVIQDLFNGTAGASTKTTVGAIQPGATGQTAEAYLTVSTNYNQSHVTRAMVDTNANNTETNEGNNLMDSAPYVLAQGGCP